MALDAVVFPQDPFTYGYKDSLYSLEFQAAAAAEEEKFLLGIINNNIEQSLKANWDSSSTSVFKDPWDSHSSPEPCTVDQSLTLPFPPPPPLPPLPPPPSSLEATTCRRKRRRSTKSAKNKEEIENQRMTHIAVERNRRKQMNEYLAVLRSLMPSSYVQRGDQASIVGGAINFVKELEQLLQSMEGQKKTKQAQENNNNNNNGSLFGEFFTFPQYKMRETQNNTATSSTMAQNQDQKHLAVADIEVTMVDSHANLKILSKKRPGQLMQMVVGLQSLRLTILHLNVTTVDDMVLYSVSVKVEDGCQLNAVDEIAAAVNQLLRTVQ